MNWNTIFFIEISVLIVLILLFLEPLKEYLVKNKYKKYRFSVYLIVSWILFLLISFIFGLFWNYNELYVLGGSALFLATRIFVVLIRKIKEKSDEIREKEKQTRSIPNKYYLTEFEFFLYISAFAFILTSFIISFSLFYTHSVPLEQNWLSGHMSTNGKDTILGMVDSIYYSGNTFFSMNYGNINPEGFLKLVSLLELLVAQILIISFIGILANELLHILKLQKVG